MPLYMALCLALWPPGPLPACLLQSTLQLALGSADMAHTARMLGRWGGALMLWHACTQVGIVYEV